MNFQDALDRNELKEYLGGFKGYAILDRYADTPTDTDAVFEPIRHRILHDETLKQRVFEGLITLATDPEYGWMAIYYFVDLRTLEQEKHVPLIEPNLVEAVATGLRQNKEVLRASRKWMGANRSNGLWGTVQGVNRILADKYDLVVLPDEL